MRLKDFVFILIIGILGGLLIYKFLQKPKQIEKKVEVKTIKTDTLYLPVIKQRIIAKAKIDTIRISEIPQYEDYFTGFEDQEIKRASADTTYSDSSLSLKIKYYYEPVNLFDINYQLKQKEIVKAITKEPSLFLGIGAGVGFDTKGRINPNVSIGVYYKILTIR
jgi:hypothetical protein